uniref:Peptidase C1A papain C-terminal domain-containing protein n=1 Tax=Hyaloperonospora arabidopsidis (strain Emoy2) TaxID=559515 RepID=M4B738_HYAAE
MTYVEDVHMLAKTAGHAFPYYLGVSQRHLTSSPRRRLSPQDLVAQELQAAQFRLPRRLIAEVNSTSSSSSSTAAASAKYWNWCDANNSFGYSVCSSVKSQQNCGSCWAFAAADAIETAVVIAEKASAAVSLSPQQFLTCSTLATTQTFAYCWATDNGVDSATWMETEIKWESQNNGCNGGMTHGAFIDAAQNKWGLMTELTMPYDDSVPSLLSANNASSVCAVSTNETAASITGWEQIVGVDCTTSSNCNTLLRSALERQPIAVAINSEDPFGEYAGGFYSCPNNGNLASKDDVNHALVLVGYGTDAVEGDYWILKNSYGSAWGASGFMKLVADSKVNCGLNIFPVIPTGASAGVAASTSIDSGGAEAFVGLSPSSWIAVAVATTIFTVTATAVGMLVSQRKMNSIRKQKLVMYAARRNGQQTAAR